MCTVYISTQDNLSCICPRSCLVSLSSHIYVVHSCCCNNTKIILSADVATYCITTTIAAVHRHPCHTIYSLQLQHITELFDIMNSCRVLLCYSILKLAIQLALLIYIFVRTVSFFII